MISPPKPTGPRADRIALSIPPEERERASELAGSITHVAWRAVLSFASPAARWWFWSCVARAAQLEADALAEKLP